MFKDLEKTHSKFPYKHKSKIWTCIWCLMSVSLDCNLNLCKNDRAMELLSALKKNILENVTELKSYTFFWFE